MRCTPYALQWRVSKGKREIRAIKTCGSIYTLSAENIANAFPWRDMRLLGTWSELYADLASLID